MDFQGWEERYRVPRADFRRGPVPWLEEQAPLLPPGRALDLAMGEGRNSVFLARRGYRVTGIDRSPTAVGRARAWAAEEGLELRALVGDLERGSLPPGPFEVVVVTRYLQRSLFGPIQEALAPGGMLVYETFTRSHRGPGPVDPAHLLQPGELRRAFEGLEVLLYRETDCPERGQGVASLLARKPPAAPGGDPGA